MACGGQVIFQYYADQSGPSPSDAEPFVTQDLLVKMAGDFAIVPHLCTQREFKVGEGRQGSDGRRGSEGRDGTLGAQGARGARWDVRDGACQRVYGMRPLAP